MSDNVSSVQLSSPEDRNGMSGLEHSRPVTRNSKQYFYTEGLLKATRYAWHHPAPNARLK